MKTRPDELALPDANVVIHLLRMDKTGQAIEAQYSLTTRRESPILCPIVEAEVWGIARYNRWEQRQVEELRDMLRAFVRMDAIHPDIVQAYVELYCEARRAGRYQQFRQNDLWIAAIARVTGAVLYTCNGKDFEWIDPAYVTVVHVDQVR